MEQPMFSRCLELLKKFDEVSLAVDSKKILLAETAHALGRFIRSWWQYAGPPNGIIIALSQRSYVNSLDREHENHHREAIEK